jgi:multidrug efflux system outer membrane protein
VAASLTGPIFTGGFLTGREAQARAEWEEAAARYEQTVRSAFGEVANTLVTHQKLRGVEEELSRQVGALEEAVGMSRERYDVGRANYFEILDAQQDLYPAQTSLARARADRLITVVQLYRALGGGWNVATEEWGGAAAQSQPAADKDEPDMNDGGESKEREAAIEVE